MLRHKISDNLKEEIAKELGLFEKSKKGAWGAVTSRSCGNLLSKLAEPEPFREK